MQKKYISILAVSAILLSSGQAFSAGKNGVAAKINGKTVTVEEIKELYEQNDQIKNKVSFNDFYAKALDIYVNGQLLYQAAVEEKVTQSPEYKQQVELAKEEIARKMYLEKQVNKTISDADVKKLYAEYKKSFKAGKEVKAKHILVPSEEKANEVIAKLGKGEKFDALAKQYSKEPADLGYFTKDMMVEEFGEAAFSMKKGQTSKKPVKTQFGYHVILVEDVRDAKPLPLKEIEPQLKAMLTQQAVGTVFADVTKNAKVEKYNLDGSVMK